MFKRRSTGMYIIPVTIESFCAFQDREDYLDSESDDFKDLSERLMDDLELVNDVDYNDHFGSHIIVTMNEWSPVRDQLTAWRKVEVEMLAAGLVFVEEHDVPLDEGER